jgi:hypothetical protein
MMDVIFWSPIPSNLGLPACFEILILMSNPISDAIILTLQMGKVLLQGHELPAISPRGVQGS